MEEFRRVQMERQHGFNAATPRRRGVLHSDPVAMLLFNAVAADLGPVENWTVSNRLRDLTPTLDQWQFAGVDPFLRLYRYGRGESFSSHQDVGRKLSPKRWTALTILLYLPTDELPLTGRETFIEDQAVMPEPWASSCVRITPGTAKPRSSTEPKSCYAATSSSRHVESSTREIRRSG